MDPRLVVDDDDAVRGLASRLLRAREFVVVGEAGSSELPDPAVRELPAGRRRKAAGAPAALPRGDGHRR